MTLYSIKPRFQALLRPLVAKLARAGFTANQVTLAACAVSIAIGLALTLLAVPPQWFLLVPLWMLLRMALNAIDGMLAREHDQRTTLGAYLNEITDVIADAALYLPFAFIAPLNGAVIGLIIFLATLTEFAGVLAQATGSSRRYDGPLGKSDRAFVFGALGLWLGVTGSLPNWTLWLAWLLAAAIGLTVMNRMRHGLAERAASD